MFMPTKNVYVSDADVPLFEQAADLAGALSTAVSAGLRLYVAQREKEGKREQMSTIELTVDDGAAVVTKRFTGRQVLRFEEREGLRTTSYRVYLTAKGQYAVYSRNDPNWAATSRTDEQSTDTQRAEAWNGEWWHTEGRTLRVFTDAGSMTGEVPQALIDALAASKDRPAVEELDI
jgi:EXLDI family protein